MNPRTLCRERSRIKSTHQRAHEVIEKVCRVHAAFLTANSLAHHPEALERLVAHHWRRGAGREELRAERGERGVVITEALIDNEGDGADGTECRFHGLPSRRSQGVNAKADVLIHSTRTHPHGTRCLHHLEECLQHDAEVAVKIFLLARLRMRKVDDARRRDCLDAWRRSVLRAQCADEGGQQEVSSYLLDRLHLGGPA